MRTFSYITKSVLLLLEEEDIKVEPKIVNKICRLFCKEILFNVVDGHEVKIDYIGTFFKSFFKGEINYNPKTGAPTRTDDHYNPSFTPSKLYRMLVWYSTSPDENLKKK